MNQHVMPEDFDPNDVPSFVNGNLRGRATPQIGSCWAVRPCGDEDTDWNRGVAFANEAIAYCNRHNFNAAIVYALAEIGRLPELSYLEIGFLDRIASAARAGVKN